MLNPRTAVAALATLLLALTPVAAPPADAGSVSFRIGVGFSTHRHFGGCRYPARGFSTYTFSYHRGYACRPYGYYRPFGYCRYAYRPRIVYGPYLHPPARVIYADRPTAFGLEPVAQVAPQPRAPRDRRNLADPADRNVQLAAAPPAPSPCTPRPANDPRDHADQALALGEYQAARDAYAQASAMNPTHPEPKIGFGVAAALDGDLRRARLAFERAFRLDGPAAFDRFMVPGNANADLHALITDPQIDHAPGFVRNALKKLAEANPQPNPPAEPSYEQRMSDVLAGSPLPGPQAARPAR
ncbi:MAG: hypothetical protein AAF078_02110 [Planctomycetota bacterium]